MIPISAGSCCKVGIAIQLRAGSDPGLFFRHHSCFRSVVANLSVPSSAGLTRGPSEALGGGRTVRTSLSAAHISGWLGLTPGHDGRETMVVALPLPDIA